jgi:hypothetical protein
MADRIVEVLRGTWRNRVMGHVVYNPSVNNGIVFVHVGTWGWYGAVQYFLHEFERIDAGGSDGQG